MVEVSYGGGRSPFLLNIIRHDVVESTNKELQKMADKGAPEGTVVVAEEQKSGRGRCGRNWFSPPKKGLWFSLLLRPREISPEKISPFTAVAATAIVAGLREETTLTPGIKWPNDIFIGMRKCGGILSELRTVNEKTDTVIIGIGLNINNDSVDFPPGLAHNATSLKIEQGFSAEREKILQIILKKLEWSFGIFLKEGFSFFRPIWIAHNITLGKMVSIRCGVEIIKGVAEDIDTEGALIVNDGGEKLRRITYGEIE